MKKIPSSEITPEQIYLSRRRFLKELGRFVLGSAFSSACSPSSPIQSLTASAQPQQSTKVVSGQSPTSGASTDELGRPVTQYSDITGYNNFYEFSFQKQDIGTLARNFKTSPWKIQVDGLVNNPKTYDMDDLRKLFTTEERIYRHRCVEAWSMVIPWEGFTLSKLLKMADPTSDAKYVRFETLYDPEQMPGEKVVQYSWPYVEGLRLDEAMHNLNLLATGIYGKDLLPQNGAPLRLVVPWKYGFKSIKSIVKISLVAEKPETFWSNAAPGEYGFYANVNPKSPHPRWSQETEWEFGFDKNKEVDTLLYNGYDKQVTSLYNGMDPKELFY